MAEQHASVSAIKITIEDGKIKQQPLDTSDQIVVVLGHGERLQLQPSDSGSFSAEGVRAQVSKRAESSAELRRGCIPTVDDRGMIWCEPYACGACMAWVEWSTDGTVGIVRCICLGG